MKKLRIKLNKRGWIILFVAIFSIVTVSTVLITGAIRAANNKSRQVSNSQNDITPTPTVKPVITHRPTVTATPTPVPDKAEDFVFPKEGVRPVAVMIDNETSKVLPQGGIGIAQIVYEIAVEYGDTRYMALFWDNLPDMIGPVRSSRHYFLDYAMEYDAIYAHIGYSDYAYRDLDLFQIDNIDGVTREAGSVFWDLTRDKSNYHDTYTSAERLNNYINKAEYPRETELSLPFTYNTEDTDPVGAQTANVIFIKTSTSSSCGFYYDSKQKNYKKTRLGEFQIDRNTNETIRAKNIIILFVKNTNIPLDRYGRKELYTTGTGEGYYITNGFLKKITWKKESRTAQTQYLDEDGKKIALNPGQTWIQIVSPDITIRIR
jgi:hypothetical protein